MAEKNLDFDTVTERRGTNCLKYDFAQKRGKPADIQPLWVADMDFRVSSYIQEALEHQVAHGIFGYSEAADGYCEAVQAWLEQHHGWRPEKEWLVKTPGIVFGLAMAVKAFTKEGESVLIQQPVYYPFHEVIRDNARRVVDNTLIQDEDGSWHMDYKDLEEKIQREKVKLLFLCNPHNPVGRVWTRQELETLGDICCKYDVVVVSDEIHADFVFKGKHQVFAGLKEEYAGRTITCTSPSKTFNIAGLQVSNLWIADEGLRKQFCRQIAASGYSQLNAMGIAACEAAYRNGEQWYQQVLRYIEDNISFAYEYVEGHIPEVKMLKPEGTYLIWLDFRRLELSGQELEKLIVEQAGLWLDDGAMFGAAGAGFQRINAACPRKQLQQALDKLALAVRGIKRVAADAEVW